MVSARYSPKGYYLGTRGSAGVVRIDSHHGGSSIPWETSPGQTLTDRKSHVSVSGTLRPRAVDFLRRILGPVLTSSKVTCSLSPSLPGGPLKCLSLIETPWANITGMGQLAI